MAEKPVQNYDQFKVEIRNIIGRNNFFFIGHTLQRNTTDFWARGPDDGNSKWTSATETQHLKKLTVFCHALVSGTGSQHDLIQEFGSQSQCLNVNRGEREASGVVFALEYEARKPSPVMEVATFAQLRAHTYDVTRRVNYFYIGRTSRVSNSLWETEPDNNKWRSLTTGKEYKKLNTFYHRLSGTAGSERELINEFKDHPRCLNESEGEKDAKGVVYVLAFAVYA